MMGVYSGNYWVCAHWDSYSWQWVDQVTGEVFPQYSMTWICPFCKMPNWGKEPDSEEVRKECEEARRADV